MAARTEVQYVSDAEGKAVSVIVPIELWQEIASERETAYLLSNEAMKKRLLEAKNRQERIPVSDEEFEALLDELSEGSENWPILSPEAFHRASFYGERG